MANAPIQQPIVMESGLVPTVWALFFTKIADLISGRTPVLLQNCLVATVPAAASDIGGLIYVSNESGGATVAFSDGTNWRRVQDRAIIS